MKVFLSAIVIIGVSICVNADLTDEQKQKIQEYGKACITESGVDKELVKKAREGSFVDDPKLKSFTFCMSKKVGFQDDAGKIQTEVVRQKLSKAINDAAAADKLIEKCLKEKATPEDSAMEIFQCYYTNTPTHISVF